MLSFKSYTESNDEVILENVQAIKSHLSHLEDLAIEEGKQGFNNFLQQVDGITRKIKGLKTKQQINLKVDGQMMILFGFDPRPNYLGQFFIATKSGLNSKNPKINHSPAEIAKNHPDYELAEKLKLLFFNLIRAYDRSGFIYQADVLFCLPNDKKIIEIEGEKHIIFTPNTITYAVPCDEKSDLYQRILNARCGVIIHEALRGVPINEGKSIQLEAHTREIVSIIETGKRANVFIESSNFKKLKVNVDDTILIDINEHLNIAEGCIRNITNSFDKEYISNPILVYISKYLNKQIVFSDGGIFGAAIRRERFSYSKFLRGFKKYLKETFGEESMKRLSLRGKQNVETRRGEVITWLDNNSVSIENLLMATYHMIQIKYLLLKLLKQVETRLGKTFFQEPDGSYRVTSQEGFVLFNGSNHVKIVDRLDFTRQNRLHSRFS